MFSVYFLGFFIIFFFIKLKRLPKPPCIYAAAYLNRINILGNGTQQRQLPTFFHMYIIKLTRNG